jgi:hypothetical protein
MKDQTTHRKVCDITHPHNYECNYGNQEMPWDRWFATFRNGDTRKNCANPRTKKMGVFLGAFQLEQPRTIVGMFTSCVVAIDRDFDPADFCNLCT